MEVSCMILISILCQQNIKSPGLPATKISSVCAGAHPILYEIILQQIHLLMLVDISLDQKPIFPLKIILRKTPSRFPGNTPLNGNGCFTRYGEDYCIIPQPQTKYSKQSICRGMVRPPAICLKPCHSLPILRYDWPLFSILHGTFPFIVKE